jgi:hypothetical protein
MISMALIVSTGLSVMIHDFLCIIGGQVTKFRFGELVMLNHRHRSRHRYCKFMFYLFYKLQLDDPQIK